MADTVKLTRELRPRWQLLSAGYLRLRIIYGQKRDVQYQGHSNYFLIMNSPRRLRKCFPGSSYRDCWANRDAACGGKPQTMGGRPFAKLMASRLSGGLGGLLATLQLPQLPGQLSGSFLFLPWRLTWAGFTRRLNTEFRYCQIGPFGPS